VPTTFAGTVFCHAPADQPFDLDALARPDDPAHRWSIAGALTAYLASSPAVAAAEWARHAGDADERSIVALALRQVDVLDVRSSGQPTAFLDRAGARGVAQAAHDLGVAGLVVPSIAFLDRPAHAFNVVLFCDRVPGGLAAVLGEPRPVGRICVRPER